MFSASKFYLYYSQCNFSLWIAMMSHESFMGIAAVKKVFLFFDKVRKENLNEK
jgi:hypothetical protein